MMNAIEKDSFTGDNLSKRTFFSYTLGGIGRDMTYSLYANFIVTFILFTKGLSDAQFATISIIIIACRVFDAINDPVVGGMVENTRTKWGKFKPWILSGAILTAGVLVIIFVVDTTGWSFVVMFGIMAFLWSLFFTMNDISYWSMLPSLSSNPKERSKLTAMANLCAGIGAIAVVAITPVLTVGENTIGGSAVTAYAVISVVVAVCLLACTSLTVFGVKERKIQPRGEAIGLKKMVSIIRKNDQLLWTALVMLLYNLGSNMVLAFGTIYVYFEFSYDGFLVVLLTVAFGVGAMFINIFYPAIAAKIKRKDQQNIFIITTTIGYSLILLVSLFMGNFSSIVKLIFICMGIASLSFGQSMFYMMLTINIANSVEYNEWLSGERNEGIIFSLRPLTAKMGSALQQLFIMVVYLAAGVTKITEGISLIEREAAKTQMSEQIKAAKIEEVLNDVTPTNKIVLSICMTVIPIILMGIAYVVIKKKFIIDEEFYQKILNDIKERKENGANTDE